MMRSLLDAVFLVEVDKSCDEEMFLSAVFSGETEL